MNCLFCETDMLPYSNSANKVLYCGKCETAFIGKSYISMEGEHFYFVRTINAKVYSIKYFLEPKEMTVYSWTGGKNILRAAWSKPNITPFNVATKLPVLLTFL